MSIVLSSGVSESKQSNLAIAVLAILTIPKSEEHLHKTNQMYSTP